MYGENWYLTDVVDYTGTVVYRDGAPDYIRTGEGRLVFREEKEPVYEYFLADHLGNTRVTFRVEGDSVSVVQENHYYPFGLLMAGLDYSGLPEEDATQNPSLYNGKEFQGDEGLGWYDYGAQFYDAQVGRWCSVDQLASDFPWQSPFSAFNYNPIINIDPGGRAAINSLDGYKDLQGNYKWYDDETEDVIYKDDKFWLKVTDDRTIFNMAAAGILDKVPEASDPGQITEADYLTSFELWLDSPSESIGEGIGKIGANIGYSLVNSPYSRLTGQTIGGKPLNSSERMDAYVDVFPALISFGLTKTGTVIKTTEKGLQGYNQFLKAAKKSEIELKGLNWQKDAGKAFQINKVNQKGLKDLDKARNILNVGYRTKKVVEK